MINRLTKHDNITNGSFSVVKKDFNGSYDTHWHEFYEIELIISGKGTYTIDGITYDVKPGMLFFMTPVNFHTLDVKNVKMYNIMFTENICDFKYLSRVTSNAFPTALQIKKEDMVFFETLLGEIAKSSDDTNYASLLLNSIIAKICKVTEKTKITDLTPISVAELYILNHFRDNISLNEVAKYIGYSSPYFSFYFKQKTGITFKEHINNLRFEYACNLLRCSDLTVMQICIESGFLEYTNFIRRFKQRYGMPPLKYRMNSKTNMNNSYYG